MRYFGKTLRPEYTDLALVIGPNMQWTEFDYEDLQRYYPEVLLGYRVRLLTVTDIHRAMRGIVPSKIVLLDGIQDVSSHHYLNLMEEVRMFRVVYGTKIEMWYVHRGDGIRRVA